jgi:hypothetical protein
MRSLTDQLKAHPHRVFLVDGAGALLTSLLLFSVLLPLNDHFRFPERWLYILGSAGGLFAAWSFTAYFVSAHRWRFFLGVVCTANAAYCVCTAALLIVFRHEITPLAILYFSVELLIVLSLCVVELWLVRSAAVRSPL